MACDHDLPSWFRVHALARAFRPYQDSGVHFESGEVCGLLQVVNRRTGELVAMDRKNLYRAIAQGVRRGYLREGSTPTYLSVPGRFVLTETPRVVTADHRGVKA
jgi:hypothetical protein